MSSYTKSKFLELCSRSEDQPDIGLRVTVKPRRLGPTEYAVFLYGLWGNGSITETELYCPFQGRQFHSKLGLPGCKEKCEAEAAKYRRWLQEYFAIAGEAGVLQEGQQS